MSNNSRPVFLVISAPSAGGKTTVMRTLLASRPSLRRAVTCTTRPPRGEEKDGVDYYFLSPEVFESRVQSGDFLEHAEVYGRRYGTLRSEVLKGLDLGQDVILSVDVQGVESIQRVAARDPVLSGALVTAFLCPPSFEELERRLRGRGEDSPEAVAARLAMARAEVERWPTFDYLVVGGTMEEDSARMGSILTAERLKTSRSEPRWAWGASTQV